jgi:hypothetical protein
MAVPDAFRSRAIAWLIFLVGTDSSVVPRPVGKFGADPSAGQLRTARRSNPQTPVQGGEGAAAPSPAPLPKIYGF